MEHPENSEEYKGLVVNKGIEQPSSVNPYLKRKPKKRQLSVAEFEEGIVKGDIKDLNSDTEQLFLNIDKTSFGFTAITKHTDKVKKQIPNIIVERPTIEDIMLSNIKGGQ